MKLRRILLRIAATLLALALSPFLALFWICYCSWRLPYLNSWRQAVICELSWLATLIFVGLIGLLNLPSLVIHMISERQPPLEPAETVRELPTAPKVTVGNGIVGRTIDGGHKLAVMTKRIPAQRSKKKAPTAVSQ